MGGLNHLSMMWPNLKILVMGWSIIFFVKVYCKEITTIGEQICFLYTPTWSHFCSHTFHDVEDHLPFFQHKGKLIKYPKKKNCLCAKMSVSYPECLSLSHDYRNCNWWGISHLSMTRLDLKFKNFGNKGGQSSFHVDLKFSV